MLTDTAATFALPPLEFADLERSCRVRSPVATPAEATFEFPLVDRDPLPRWSFGRITFLGDAAHPMYPIGSNGASRAILNARSLTDAPVSESGPQRALEQYDTERRPATAAVVAANRGHGAGCVLNLAEELAPDGFASVDDVFAPGELVAMTGAYRTFARFTREDVASKLGRPHRPGVARAAEGRRGR